MSAFTAAGTGTFASDPAPSVPQVPQSTPEPGVLAYLPAVVGAGLLRRRVARR
jgi:hypothetical protein